MELLIAIKHENRVVLIMIDIMIKGEVGLKVNLKGILYALRPAHVSLKCSVHEEDCRAVAEWVPAKEIALHKKPYDMQLVKVFAVLTVIMQCHCCETDSCRIAPYFLPTCFL
eukprot:1153202-Pelagomonas_calceolata.AAC.1